MWYYGYPQYEHFTQLPFYLTGIGQHECQPPVFRPNGLARHQFLFAEHGNGILRTEKGTIEISAGSGFYLAAGMWHEYHPATDDWDIRWVSCGGTGAKQLCENLNIESGICYPLSSVHALDHILQQMRQAAVSFDISSFYQASSYVNPFIVTFALESGILPKNENANDRYGNHIKVIQDYIEENYMRDLPLDELCRQICVTPQHLCRIFQKCMGIRPVTYINEVRLKHVKDYLEGSDYSVEQIAFYCGFQSADYMRRIFRKETGMSPRQFRSSVRAGGKNLNL